MEPTPQNPLSKMIYLVTASVVLAALIVGGGVYVYEKNQQTSAAQGFQSQIDTLKSELLATQTPTPEASPTATPTPTDTPTPTPTSTPVSTTCQSTNLKLAFGASTGGGAAGTAYYDITLTNAGTKTCTVNGFPTVSLLDKNGAVLGSATNDDATAASEITLAAGKSVYALLGFPNAGNFDPGTCSAAAASLSVTPPDNTSALKIANTKQYCPGFSVRALSTTKE